MKERRQRSAEQDKESVEKQKERRRGAAKDVEEKVMKRDQEFDCKRGSAPSFLAGLRPGRVSQSRTKMEDILPDKEARQAKGFSWRFASVLVESRL
jgi:hypothetical protein